MRKPAVVRALPTQNSMQSQPTTWPAGDRGAVAAVTPSYNRLPGGTVKEPAGGCAIWIGPENYSAHSEQRRTRRAGETARSDSPERPRAFAPARRRSEHRAGAARPAAGKRRSRRLRAGARPTRARLRGAGVHDVGDRAGPRN